jgi:hypothetical protein
MKKAGDRARGIQGNNPLSQKIYLPIDINFRIAVTMLL